MFDAARVPSEIGWYLAGFTDGEGSFKMNDGGKRRYTDEAILAAFENPQRLHARPSDEAMLDG
jgi:hypothetical protein